MPPITVHNVVNSELRRAVNTYPSQSSIQAAWSLSDVWSLKYRMINPPTHGLSLTTLTAEDWNKFPVWCYNCIFITSFSRRDVSIGGGITDSCEYVSYSCAWSTSLCFDYEGNIYRCYWLMVTCKMLRDLPDYNVQNRDSPVIDNPRVIPPGSIQLSVLWGILLFLFPQLLKCRFYPQIEVAKNRYAFPSHQTSHIRNWAGW